MAEWVDKAMEINTKLKEARVGGLEIEDIEDIEDIGDHEENCEDEISHEAKSEEKEGGYSTGASYFKL